MRILIAESKTMSEREVPVSSDAYLQHHPELDSIATTFMRSWSEWTADEIASVWKISPAMAVNFKRMAHDFSYKGLGHKALEAFTGVVFKSFDYATLTRPQQQRADSTINIISSLYGWLKGDDIIKPYRLDFNTKSAPTGETMAKYWKPLITPILRDSLRSQANSEILDLLPAEAAKCIDWRIIKRCMINVVKVEFRSVADGGSLNTPHATLLKSLRGQLLRHIVKTGIDSIDALMAYESPTMCIDPNSDPKSGKITILC